jgi:predicted amidohydrolase YtcJ
MQSRSRSSSLLCGILLCATALKASADEQPPDAVYLGGRIFTADPTKLWVEAFAVKGTRIAAVGSRAQIERLVGTKTRRIELGGHTVIPGLNDAHHHFAASTPDAVTIPPPASSDWNALQAAIVLAAEKASAGALLEGEISTQAWYDKNATRTTLDRFTGAHPVVLITAEGHEALLNTAALNRFHFGENPPGLEGGWFERTANGRSTNGRLLEAAVFLMKRRRQSEIPRSLKLSDLRAMAAEEIRLGWTSIQTMAAFIAVDTMAALAAEAATPLRIRVIRFPINIDESSEFTLGDQFSQLPPNVTVSGLKWFLDGVPAEKTAAIRGFYNDGTKPRALYSPQQVRFMLQKGLEQHQQLLFHVGGEAGIEELFTAMEAIVGIDWPSRRVRIEHGDELREDLFARAKHLGVVLVENPFHFGLEAGNSAEAQNARDFPQGPAYILRSVVEAGIPLALGTDGPNNLGLNILLASTNPSHPAEALTREQAVIAFTRGAAFAEFKEEEKGTLAPGMLADFVVLSKDIFTASAAEVADIHSELTVIGGQVAFEASMRSQPGGR